MRIDLMKLVLLGAAAVLVAPAGVRGAGSGSKSGALSEDLQEGLQKLHAANQSEVASGKLAGQAAASPQVKAFGKQMVTDHGKNDKHLATLAKNEGVNLKGEAYQKKMKDAQDMMKDVQGKTGKDFDRAYTDLMLSDHEKDLKEVKDLAEKARDSGNAQLASFLGTTAQTIDNHRMHAEKLREEARQASAASGTGAGESESNKVPPTGAGAKAPSPAEQSSGGSSAGQHSQ